MITGADHEYWFFIGTYVRTSNLRILYECSVMSCTATLRTYVPSKKKWINK